MDIEQKLKELRKKRLYSAVTAAIVIGLIDCAIIFLMDLFKEQNSVTSFLNIAEFLTVCWGLYYFTKRYTFERGKYGVTYSNAIGFQLLVSFFAAILVGMATFVVMFHISPDYYLSLYKEVLLLAPEGKDSYESFASLYGKFRDVPVIVISYLAIVTMLKWLFPALIISALVKNSSNPLQGFEQESNNNSNEEER